MYVRTPSLPVCLWLELRCLLLICVVLVVTASPDRPTPESSESEHQLQYPTCCAAFYVYVHEASKFSGALSSYASFSGPVLVVPGRCLSTLCRGLPFQGQFYGNGGIPHDGGGGGQLMMQQPMMPPGSPPMSMMSPSSDVSSVHGINSVTGDMYGGTAPPLQQPGSVG